MKRVLVCVLDWGLGHASRSVPVIRELQTQGAEVIIASSGPALHLLRQEFPNLSCVELPGYNPVYQKQGSLALKLLPQLPGFAKTVKTEHAFIEKLVGEKNIERIVSDNRYGCWSEKVRSAFITHQLNVLVPRGYGWLSSLINRKALNHIQRFNEVWIPDQPNSGLTSPFMDTRVSNQKFIGWLSRFGSVQSPEIKYKVIGVVSGPEPQRSMFRELLLGQMKQSGWKCLLVAGEPDKTYNMLDGEVEVVSHLRSKELELQILSSEWMVSRSGYSTIMDIIVLGKNAVFVPTPGQPEQIFLANHLRANKIVYSDPQDSFNLRGAIEKSEGYSGLASLFVKNNLLGAAINTFLS